jgi:flagellar basal-body rod protein FlgF
MSEIASKTLSAAKKVQVRRLEFITNNIANSLTPGYKASKPSFQNLLLAGMEGLKGVGPSPSVDEATSFIDFSEAPLIETKGKLDFAIEGNGFFVVSTDDGPLYTRNGQFRLDEQKRVVTTGSGYPVMGEGGEITIKGNDVMVEGDGSIRVDRVLVDKIKIVDFKDKTSLQNFGMSLFRNANIDSTESVPETFFVRQGSIESSNVNVMLEMVNLIDCLRAYQAYSKANGQIERADTKMMEITRSK